VVPSAEHRSLLALGEWLLATLLGVLPGFRQVNAWAAALRARMQP